MQNEYIHIYICMCTGSDMRAATSLYVLKKAVDDIDNESIVVPGTTSLRGKSKDVCTTRTKPNMIRKGYI